VRVDHPLDLFSDLVALASQHDELFGEPRENLRSSVRSGNDNGLLAESGPDLVSDAVSDPWSETT
jgi:hypothetical protein